MGNEQQPLEAPQSYLKDQSLIPKTPSKLKDSNLKNSSVKSSKIKKDTPEFNAMKNQKTYVALSKAKAQL